MNARVKQNVAVISSPPVQALRPRPLRDEDEAAFTAGHRAMAGVLDSIVTVDGKHAVLRFWIDRGITGQFRPPAQQQPGGQA